MQKEQRSCIEGWLCGVDQVEDVFTFSFNSGELCQNFVLPYDVLLGYSTFMYIVHMLDLVLRHNSHSLLCLYYWSEGRGDANFHCLQESCAISVSRLSSTTFSPL